MEQFSNKGFESSAGSPPPPWLPTAQSQLEWLVSSITTGATLERIADAIAEAIMTKLARYQKLEVDAQFIADAVAKRIEEERQIQRLAAEIIRKGVEQKTAEEKGAKPESEATAL